MAQPTTLARPPITEALVDLRATVDQPPEAFERFARTLAGEFPKLQVRRGISAELRIDQGKLVPPVAEDLGFQGVRLSRQDQSLVLQLRPDGFTLNNLTDYIGGDRLISEALRLWSLWVECAKPAIVTRVALRYLSRLELPIRDGDEFTKYLTAPPELPEGAPQGVSEFLSRVVAHDAPTDAVVTVTQRLEPPKSNVVVLHLDVDAIKLGEFAIDAATLRPVLEMLRMVKNRTFFSLLTEETVRLYT
jgi:uncharacterized protein (TIGR04255 family)